MEILVLKSHRFRTEREADWRRLERLLDFVERGQGSRLNDDDVLSLPVLYRSALSSLSTARAISLDQNLIAYLESLCTRAYFYVYGARPSSAQRALRFVAQDWPTAVRALWLETIISAVLGLMGTAASYLLVRSSAQWFYAFIPAQLAEGRDPTATTESLRDVLFHPAGPSGLTVFSSFLFTHNAEVALMAFALGFACCLPTVFLVFTNGLMLGALFALYVDHGLGIALGGWLFIHGVTELFAITLAGAAGFRIGWTLAFPGNATRLDALTNAGRVAATVMVGVIVMLAVAGLFEGYARQLIVLTWERYLIAAATGCFWLFYFYIARVRL
jgi:uncharacterized membrane protein SpoIIM required for sporulation